MSLQVSAVVLNELVDAGSASAYSNPMDISGYKRIAVQGVCQSAGGGTCTIEVSSVPASVAGGSPQEPLAGSFVAITAATLTGGVWFNTLPIDVTSRWIRAVFTEAVPTIENIKVVITAQG